MLRAPIMWYGTSRNFLFSTQPCLAQTLASSAMRPHGGVVLKQQVQHRHEVRLAGTEAAVQVARLAARRFDGRLDEAEGVVEAGDQLRRDHVLFERLLRLGDALGQVENEVALADPLRQVEQFADEFFGIVTSSLVAGWSAVVFDGVKPEPPFSFEAALRSSESRYGPISIARRSLAKSLRRRHPVELYRILSNQAFRGGFTQLPLGSLPSLPLDGRMIPSRRIS